jgi:hypothetical protein
MKSSLSPKETEMEHQAPMLASYRLKIARQARLDHNRAGKALRSRHKRRQRIWATAVPRHGHSLSELEGSPDFVAPLSGLGN